MKKKTYKIIICIGLVMMIFANFSSVFGAINDSYKKNTKVTDSALDSKIQGSALLDILANMINAVASLAETLIGYVFQVLTKDKIFPWADRIIFNSIEFLDINFLNPAPNSLFGTADSPSVLGKVVKRVYSTIFSLAILFLGVAVGVMAIRLAISSIAAEKARYKQAIVNWATCIVMLFLMHYTLAFIFWINEQLVEIASNILIQTIKDENLGNVSFLKALDINDDERVENFISMTESTQHTVKMSLPEQLSKYVDGDKEDTYLWNQYTYGCKLIKKNPKIASDLLTNPAYTPGAYSKNEDTKRIANEDAVDEKSTFASSYMSTIATPVLALDTDVAVTIAALKKNNKSEFEKEKNRGCIKGSLKALQDVGSPAGTWANGGYGLTNVYLTENAFKSSDDYVLTLKMVYVCFVKEKQNLWNNPLEKPWWDKVRKTSKI